MLINEKSSKIQKKTAVAILKRFLKRPILVESSCQTSDQFMQEIKEMGIEIERMNS